MRKQLLGMFLLRRNGWSTRRWRTISSYTFPHRTYDDLKGFIKEAFPMSSTKRLGKLRHTHVLGIETKPGDSHTSAASLEDVIQLQRRAELAEKRLCEAAEENKMLKQRIDQLQKYSPLHLSEQLSSLMLPKECSISWSRHQASWACGLLHPRSLIFALFWVRSREIRDQALWRNREPGDEASGSLQSEELARQFGPRALMIDLFRCIGVPSHWDVSGSSLIEGKLYT